MYFESICLQVQILSSFLIGFISYPSIEQLCVWDNMLNTLQALSYLTLKQTFL